MPDHKDGDASRFEEALTPEQREELLRTGVVVEAEPILRQNRGWDDSVRSFRTPIPWSYCEEEYQTWEVLDIAAEEEAIIWFWARPELLPWPRPVEWLFSPLLGNQGMAIGDLWGVDSDGELLIIENKLARGGSRSDPLSKLCGHWTAHKDRCSTKKVQEKWADLLEKEIQEPRRLHPKCGLKEGLLPHSSKCNCLRRWPDLTSVMEHRVRTERYKSNVERFLKEREAEPRPHYCGLVVKIKEQDGNRPSYENSRTSLKRLQEEHGSDHVHLFEVYARCIPDDLLEIVASTVPM